MTIRDDIQYVIDALEDRHEGEMWIEEILQRCRMALRALERLEEWEVRIRVAQLLLELPQPGDHE